MMWWEGPLVGFDTETTHREWDEARIVQSALCGVTEGHVDWVISQLIDPGIPIPAESIAVHGITDADVMGSPTGPEAIEQLTETLVRPLNDRIPVVAFNARYDFSVLERELIRHNLPRLGERIESEFAAVIDPYVMDKAIDPYRPGKRTLGDLCQLYGVELTDAHDAGADAVAAAQLAYRMISEAPVLQMPLSHLLNQQSIWARRQALSLQSYLRRKNNDPTIKCAPQWPIVPVESEETA